ncbi:MAG: hypothetical protein K5776_04290 [Lachnospiraceae bacterium]|nr:hypothetical protein [Lachnospiraceae bacterium]
MNKNVFKILKELGLLKLFTLVLLLRLPFDFLNAVLSANMIESFIRISEVKDSVNLLKTFGVFLFFTFILFAYNALIWSTISIYADMLFHKKLRNRILDIMLSSTGRDMEKLSAGDWITRLNNDVDRTSDYLVTPINFMHVSIAAFNMFLSSLVLVFLNSSLYLLTILVMIPFFILSNVIIIRKIPLYRKKSQEAYAKYTNWMEPIIESKEAITVFDGQDAVMEKVEEASREILRNNLKAHMLTAWSSFFNIFSGNLGYLLMFIMGNSMIGSELKDFAELMKITQYRAEMLKSINVMNVGFSNMRTNVISAVRIEEILNMEKENWKKDF